MKLPVYLDYSATTPVDPRVLEAMLPYFCEIFGNAASLDHEFGAEAARAVEQGRKQVAGLINCQPDEIIFTSGATEADNLALITHDFFANGVDVNSLEKSLADTLIFKRVFTFYV